MNSERVTTRLLDPDNIARIGLMFLDGDSFESVLLDRVGHVDYNFEAFNRCKIPLMKIERMNPDLAVTAVLWQPKLGNPDVMLPLVAGKALPFEGWQFAVINDAMRGAMSGVFGAVRARSSACASHYYPIRNSDAEIVGVLELIVGDKEAVDI